MKDQLISLVLPVYWHDISSSAVGGKVRAERADGMAERIGKIAISSLQEVYRHGIRSEQGKSQLHYKSGGRHDHTRLPLGEIPCQMRR